jgi:MFS family permease
LPRGAETPWPSRAHGNYALAVLILAFGFSFLDRVILSMLMIPIQQDLAFSDIQLALLHGFAFAIFYAVAGFPLGRLADTVSRKRLAAVGVAVWSLFTAACGLAQSFVGLFVSRVGVGVGEAALSPAAFSLLSDYFPPERRARAIATYQLGVTVGASVAYLLGGLVIAIASRGEAIDVPGIGAIPAWRATFLFVGLPGLLIALLALTIREPARREVASSRSVAGPTLGAWLSDNVRTVTCFALGVSGINIAFNALIAWGPTWLVRVYHLAPATVGLVLGLSMLFAGCIGQLLGAWRSDRLLARGISTAVFDTGALCAVVLIPISVALIVPMLGVAVPLIGATLFFACAAIGHAPSLIGQIAPNHLRGQVSAIYLFAVNVIGTGVGPFVVAVLTERVFADPLMVGTSIALTAASGAAVGAVLLRAGRGALARSAAALARSIEE